MMIVQWYASWLPKCTLDTPQLNMIIVRGRKLFFSLLVCSLVRRSITWLCSLL